MQFQNPNFLYALSLIVIPIIIHLFNFRKFKKIYFSNTQFLKDVQLETKKQSNLKHLLILASRILAIIALVLAFAKPFIPASNNKSVLNNNNVIVLFLDNSFSMQSQGDEGMLLDIAKKRALEIVKAYRPTDKFHLFTNENIDFERNPISKEDCIQAIEEVELSPVSTAIDHIIKWTASESIAKSTSSLYVISDFQKSILQKETLRNDSSLKLFLVPLISEIEKNVYIDTLYVSSPVNFENEIINIQIRIVNNSETDIDKLPINLLVNGEQKAVSSVAIPSQSSVSQQLTFRIDSAGFYQGMISIQDYPIVYDDKMFFSLNIFKKIDVLEIRSEKSNKYIKAYYSIDSAFAFNQQNENNIDFSAFKKYSTIVLNELSTYSSGLGSEIKEFVENGGCVFIIPEANKADAINPLLLNLSIPTFSLASDTGRQKIREVDILSEIFKDVYDLPKGKTELPKNSDFPQIYKHFKFDIKSKPDSKVIISLENSDPYFIQFKYGIGTIFLLTSSLDLSSSTLASNSLFVPMLFNIAKQGIQLPKLYYNLTDDEDILTKFIDLAEDEKLIIKNKNKSEFIPEIVRNKSWLILKMNNQIKESGNYVLQRNGKDILPLSFNYGRLESERIFYSPNELNKIIDEYNLKNTQVIDTEIPNLTKWISEKNNGISLWKIFILAVLILLLIEVLLLRFLV